MLTFVKQFRSLLASEKGQGLAEYALILVLISIAAILVMPELGKQISDTFTAVKNALVPAA